MKFSLSLFLLIILSNFTNAQSILRGKVLDSKKQPVEFASVLLLHKNDSTLYRSALTDQHGEYIFNNVAQGSYRLSISQMGQNWKQPPIDVTTSDVKMPDIVLPANSTRIKEVTITGRKPFLEQRSDKLVVNVDASATAAGSTALEVLQKVPGIIITNDKVSLVGKGNPSIWIDGRATQYTDITQVLRDLSAGNIDRIEVIGNPGAAYDAAGGAIINIILKRNSQLGTNGSASLTGGAGIYAKGTHGIDRNFYRLSPSVSINHRQGKLSVFGNYSFFKRNFYDYSEFSRIINPNQFYQTNYNPTTVSNHNYRIGADLFSDKKNTFGIIIRGFNRDGDKLANNATEQRDAMSKQLKGTFETINDTRTKRNNFGGNLNWKHNFDTLGTYLNLDLDYSKFNSNNENEITNFLSDGSSYINNQKVKNPVKLAVVKVDYVKTLSKDATIEMGLKSSLASIDNYLTYINNNVLDVDRSTDFEYNENLNAAYSSYRQKLQKWTFQAGLRAEQTIAKGKDESGTVLDRNYVQLFPSLFITREIKGGLATVLQYSRRVNRPSFNQQNPFIEYLDSLTYTQGNPRLKPETADQYKLSVTYKSQPFFSLSYNKKQDVIFENAPKQNGNFTYTTSENLASFDNFAAELNFPLNLGKKISGYGGNQFIYNKYKADYLDGTFNRGKWNWLAYWQVNYKPTSTLNFEVSGYYMTDFLNEFLVLKEMGSLNAAIQKTFWNKRGRVSLNVNDILFSDNAKASIVYQQINVDFRQFHESRNARLTFSYSFGNQKLKGERNRKTASEDESNRVKTN